MRKRLGLSFGILIIAGILFTIFLMNSSAAVSDSPASDTGAVTTPDSQNLNANAASESQNILNEYKKMQKKSSQSLKDKQDLTNKRNAAAERYKKAGGAPRSVVISTVATPSAVTIPLPVGMDPGGLPHYYGPYPNYANSPIPTTAVAAGNPLIERAYASDFPVPAGQLASVFVVVPTAVLPAGTLLNFQTVNQATNGSSPFPSAGNIFYAYVLRPTGTPNQYTVVFNSSLLTVPTLTTPGISDIATFPVTPFTVVAGDVIGFYGQGIPVDTGTGTDNVSAPAPMPVDGSMITLGETGTSIPNRTYSISATVDTTTISGGIRKFVDTLPGLNAGGANNLGQYIPVAIPDKITYPGSDYYEIELGEYSEKMHSDLPPTTLRGYRQTNTLDATVSQFHYLGPLIVAARDTPVRIKFTNKLPNGTGGDLFLPVDTTIMGAGPYMIDDPANPGLTIEGNFTQNRATLHLHGGFVTWISDGTPHQWTTPADQITNYPEGVSVSYVPDMFFDANGNPVPAGTAGATNNPGNGSLTFYYNNQQSARLQFYHDHSFGITRLNVYAGEAAGYLITDQVETDMIDGTNISGVNPTGVKVLPDVGIPLVIEDKTFVDATTIAQQDPTWNWGTGPRDPVTGKITGVNTGDLWLPHVFMPNQNPMDPSGMSAFGRWFYSPWFFPAPTDIKHGPIPNPYCLPTPGPNGDCSASVWPMENDEIPDVPNPSFAMEAFMDTPIVNGAAYPNVTVEPKTYRFRILNAANDRFLNLQMYVAADKNSPTTAGTTGAILCDGTTGVPVSNCTEVKMVPAVANASYPAGWPVDGREGGVPDPATAGPSFIQIGTEGGFLPAPVVLDNLPVGWNLDQTNFDMGVVNQGTLIVGTAERADVIVDFSAFAGKTIILYNDAPAPFPAIDARYNYYTGNPDLRDTGGAPSTLAGYGPNTRTIMQIHVNNSAPAAPYDLAALQGVFALTSGKRGVFESSQDEIIVQQKAYESAYNKTYPADRFVRINDLSKIFKTALGTPMNITFQPKAIHDEPSGVYSVEDGRMSAMLGLTVTGRPMTFVPIPYIAPPVEIIKDSVYGTPLGSTGDGTQIWKITHNGVDTHTVHFHLFNVQLINRVAWDNAVRQTDPNELGWKETLRVSPLQDTIVALRPTTPTQPFKVPNSIRPIDVTMPVGEPLNPPSFGWQDINGNPVTVLNNVVNFGWEYVYHCHLLGHEEMDMMHAVSLTVAPDAPSNVYATPGTTDVTVTWTDNSTNELNWTIQRATNVSGPWTNVTIASTTSAGTGTTVTYIDSTVNVNTAYYYRVFATNVVGDTTYGADRFPTMVANSTPSNIAATAKLTVFARSASNSVIYRKWDGISTSWSAWQDLGGNINSNVTATTSGRNITIFARNTTDNAVVTNKWNGSAWIGWQSLGSNVIAEISATSSGNEINIFARSPANAVLTNKWNGSAWIGWQSLGGTITSNIAASSSGSNITIFVRGGPDNGIWYMNWNGSSWSSWRSLGGTITSDPASVSSAGQTYVFVRGGPDNGVWYRKGTGTSYSGWQSLGGTITSNIAATSSGSNITMFIRGGPDNGIWYKYWNGISWSGWQGLGGTITSDPESVSSAGQTYVFVRGGPDNGVWYRKGTGTSYSGWQGLGGLPAGRPEATNG